MVVVLEGRRGCHHKHPHLGGDSGGSFGSSGINTEVEGEASVTMQPSEEKVVAQSVKAPKAEGNLLAVLTT